MLSAEHHRCIRRSAACSCSPRERAAHPDARVQYLRLQAAGLTSGTLSGIRGCLCPAVRVRRVDLRFDPILDFPCCGFCRRRRNARRPPHRHGFDVLPGRVLERDHSSYMIAVGIILVVLIITPRYRRHRPSRLERGAAVILLRTERSAELRQRASRQRRRSQPAQGEIRAVIGPNGAGKTTLASMISGRIRPSSGRIFKERDVTGQELAAARSGIVYTFQITSIFQNLTCYDNVALAIQQPLMGASAAGSIWTPSSCAEGRGVLGARGAGRGDRPARRDPALCAPATAGDGNGSGTVARTAHHG